MGIITTDLTPKLAMEECKIGSSDVKIYGIAKGSGMIFPKMATTLGYIFTDADLPSGFKVPMMINFKNLIKNFILFY